VVVVADIITKKYCRKHNVCDSPTYTELQNAARCDTRRRNVIEGWTVCGVMESGILPLSSANMSNPAHSRKYHREYRLAFARFSTHCVLPVKFAKLRKATISFVMYVCLSVRRSLSLFVSASARDNVGKFATAREATDDNIIPRMRICRLDT
jgi:hypothetical protein